MSINPAILSLLIFETAGLIRINRTTAAHCRLSTNCRIRGSHSGAGEEYSLCDVTPCRLANSHHNFAKVQRLHRQRLAAE